MTAGKSGSSRNATKFGIFATVLLSGEALAESKDAYLDLLSGLRKTYRPANCHSEILVEKLAFLYLRLSRVYKADLRSAPKLFAKAEEALEDNEPKFETEYVGAYKEYEVVVFPTGPSPDLLIRYEAHIERQIARTQEQIETVQTIG